MQIHSHLLHTVLEAKRSRSAIMGRVESSALFSEVKFLRGCQGSKPETAYEHLPLLCWRFRIPWALWALSGRPVSGRSSISAFVAEWNQSPDSRACMGEIIHERGFTGTKQIRSRGAVRTPDCGRHCSKQQD